MKEKVKVLIIDDSAVVRNTLTSILSSDNDIKVVGTASDPYVAAQKLKKEIPDVITLDIEMPRMDGITFLHRLMSQHPIPVVVISTLTEKGTGTALKALEYGAIEVIGKPKIDTAAKLRESTIKLCDKVKAAACTKIRRLPPSSIFNDPPKLPANLNLKKTTGKSPIKTTEKVIAIGASTGGTEAIKSFLLAMPLDCSGIVIVQHMPEIFTKQFARMLNDKCSITVKEAKNGDTVLRGQALIAPGNHHMLLKRNGARYYVEIKDGPLVGRHKPSVDVLFRATARYAGSNAIGIIMTGMGKDGAKGLLEMKEAGAHTIAQDEASSVIFGMPKEAIRLKAVDNILPLKQIAPNILKIIN
ncbi:chemotaxis response regulator protein-glutamate methylesterase [Fulvivirgaceae bacterium BMA12]|uniref:Protein-glutamate methylesterase/protein-glutamine glutaminase n=1 Tax=Agaribacillus aureus TaxID=3051825 RepID=A0ABT8KZN9_9BACT|nr:chemotaxis response regulator protein-glutamate methylesterase [Fulvivirgaceae bacterium BMA12]